MKKKFDAEQSFNKMFVYMQRMEQRLMKEMDVRSKHTDDRFDHIENILDESTGDYKILVSESAAYAHATRRIDNVLENHETRIEQLENPGLEKQEA